MELVDLQTISRASCGLIAKASKALDECKQGMKSGAAAPLRRLPRIGRIKSDHIPMIRTTAVFGAIID